MISLFDDVEKSSQDKKLLSQKMFGILHFLKNLKKSLTQKKCKRKLKNS